MRLKHVIRTEEDILYLEKCFRDIVFLQEMKTLLPRKHYLDIFRQLDYLYVNKKEKVFKFGNFFIKNIINY